MLAWGLNEECVRASTGRAARAGGGQESLQGRSARRGRKRCSSDVDVQSVGRSGPGRLMQRRTSESVLVKASACAEVTEGRWDAESRAHTTRASWELEDLRPP